MKFGFSPTQAGTDFTAMIEQSKLAEALGFDVLWAHEHHTLEALYPSPLMVLASLAAPTNTIRLGTNMLLLPLYHPLRVAEDAAMLSILSEGRLILGVAVGYVEEEFKALGVSLKERGRRMDRGLELLRPLWEGEPVSASGPDFELREHKLFPLPPSPPPIYVGGLVPRAIRRAARLADGYLLSAGTSIEEVSPRVELYREALQDEPALPVGINRIVQVVPSRAEKERVLRIVGKAFLGLYDRWGHDDIKLLKDRDRFLEETARAHFILGEPQECIERIQAYEELGVGHIACLMNFGNPGLGIVDRSMRLFGEKVMPAFQ